MSVPYVPACPGPSLRWVLLGETLSGMQAATTTLHVTPQVIA